MADYQSSHSGPTIDTRVSQVATNTADIAALKSRMNSAEGAIETKADATSIATLSSQISGITGKIPSDATTSNKLADKAYVNSGLSGKVDKVGGMGLSTNDYTTAEKNKLAALPTNSELTTALAGKASASTVSDLSSSVAAINSKIPSAASSSNQLADKAYVSNAISSINLQTITTSDIDALFA